MPSDVSDGELADELLALVDTTKKKHKRHRRGSSEGGKPAKRHKRLQDSDSDAEDEDKDGDEPESEEDATSNPYPLEGKYIDADDRTRIMEMPEFEREEVLAQRAEEMQKFQDSYNLNQMFKAQTGGGGADDNNVSSAAKRKHHQRGATKEKADRLSEYKAKRKAKDERRKAVREKGSSPRRGDDSDDMEISSEEEDGEINKDQQLEDRARNVFEKKPSSEPPIEIADAQKVLLRRDQLTKYYDMPWFGEYVKGAFVRYLIGQEGSEPVYRMCEVLSLGTDTVKPYDVAGKMMNQQIELKHGKNVKFFNMDRVSNTTLTQREFDRFVKMCQFDKVALPTKNTLDMKHDRMKKMIDRELTEDDLNAMLARKNALQPPRSRKHNIFNERTKLIQERKLAIAREDFKEAELLDAKIRAMEMESGENSDSHREPDTKDLMAKVNERNRLRNLEAVRKAEAEAAHRKRMERKALASGTATPTGGGGSSLGLDPSARLRTVPKLFNDRSRGATPNGATTPKALTPNMDGGGPPGRSVSPIPPLTMPPAATANGKTAFDTKVMSIEIDLGDF